MRITKQTSKTKVKTGSSIICQQAKWLFVLTLLVSRCASARGGRDGGIVNSSGAEGSIGHLLAICLNATMNTEPCSSLASPRFALSNGTRPGLTQIEARASVIRSADTRIGIHSTLTPILAMRPVESQTSGNERSSLVMSVKSFGAMCDGVTDDTTAVQNALNEAGKMSGTVSIPAGSTCLVSSLSMDHFVGVSVVGGTSGPNPPSGNTQSTIQFTGTCAPSACLLTRSAIAITFSRIELSWPNAISTMWDMSHSASGRDSQFITCHGCVLKGPNLTVGPMIRDVQTDFVTFDQWTQFSNASVYVTGPTTNGQYSDMTTFNNVVFGPPGTAVIQNASVEWVVNQSNAELYNSFRQCVPFLQYTGGYTDEQGLAITSSEFLVPGPSCGRALSLISIPAGSTYFGAETISANLMVGPQDSTNVTLLTVGDNEQVSFSGNTVNLFAILFSLGTNDTLNVSANEYSNISIFMSGTPASGIVTTPSGLVVTYGPKPTILSGFGISPRVLNSSGPGSFEVQVGAGGTAWGGVIGLPSAPNGWACQAADVTNPTTGGGYYSKQIASTTTTATFNGFNTSGVAAPWSAGDVLNVSCTPF